MPARTLRTASAALLFSAIFCFPRFVGAQVMASQPGKVAQTVDGTTITVEYYRPVARGRAGLFGRVVKWEEVWTPGANWATTLEVDKDVRLNNHPLPKGKYSVWMKVEKDSNWTFILSKTARVFHTVRPSKDEEQLRFTVNPEEGPHTEVLTWSFPAVMRDGAQLRMQWGTTAVPVLVSVEPSRPPVITADERKRYLGKWELNLPAEGTYPAVIDTVEIADVGGTLKVRGNPVEPAYDDEFDLVPIGGNQFHPSYFRKGQPFGMEPAETFVFTVERGRAISLELLGPDGMAFGRGTRVN